MIVNGGDDGDVSRLPSPPFGICGGRHIKYVAAVELWYNSAVMAMPQSADAHGRCGGLMGEVKLAYM